MSLPKMIALKNEWTSLQDLLGDDFNSSKGYLIHLNDNARLTVRKDSETPSADYGGSVYPTYSEIITEAGDKVYMRAKTLFEVATAEIYEV